MVTEKTKPMGKKRERQDGTTTTKISADLVKKAKQIAASRDVTLYDFLDGLLRPAVEREFTRMAKDIGRQEKGE